METAAQTFPETQKTKRMRVVSRPYTKNTACSKCKKARSKCEGYPTCERCVRLDHECIRGLDHRKALTRRHEQNLRHQNENLRLQVEEMKTTIDTLVFDLSLLRPQASNGAHIDSIRLANETDSYIRTSSRKGTHQPGPSDLRTSDSDEPNPCSESDSDSSVESDEEHSEPETINVDGRRSIFAIHEYGHIREHGLITPFRSLRTRTRSQRMLSFRRQKEDSPTRNERHVLMLPGLTKEELEPHCKCETPCWARFLPPGVPLSRMSHDLLLDRFFFFYSSWCLRIIPAYFLRDMYRYLHDNSPSSPPRTAHYSPFLHLAVLAVATAFSDDPVIASGDVRKSFADLAKSQLEKELGTPSLSAVQGLSMLGSFHSGLGEQTLGFVYFGMSTRISQALGLGADYAQLVQKGKMKPRDLFDRYWAFHMECAQDACWALYVGRDFGIPVSQNEPYTLAELADPILDRMSWRKSGVQPQVCWTFSTFLYSCGLMKISRKIMAIMRVISKARNGNELKLEVADIDEQLINWQEDLPNALKVNTSSSGRHTALPHVLMMHCSLWWLMILLHGPFYRRRKASALDNSFNISRCKLAAKEILALVRIWRDLYGKIRFAPITLIQVVFAAGTMHLLSAHQALLPCNTRLATTAHANALARVEESIMALDELGQSWPHARKIADSFRKLGDAQRQRMAMRIPVSGKADGPLGDKQSREARSEGYLPSEGMLATTAPSLERPAVFELTSYDTPISTSTSTQSRPLPGTFGNDNSLESSENEFDFAYYALSSETLDSGLFPGIQIDESSVFDYMGSGWSMADGGSLPDQPFAVGLGDSFGTIPAEWSEVMDSTAYSTDFGAEILYEITSMDLHELEDF